MTRPVIVLGAGGHALVVIRALEFMGRKIAGVSVGRASSEARNFGFSLIDDDEAVVAMGIEAVELANGIGAKPSKADTGIGVREQVYKGFCARGFQFAVVLGPGAIVASDAVLGDGAQIMAGAIIQPKAQVGDNSVINTGASIDHDCQVGAHAFVGPGAILCGGVTVGSSAFIGAGATLLPGVSIGPGAIVGGGVTVRRDVVAGGCFVG